MEPMFLASVEKREPGGVYEPSIRALESAGLPVPQIMRLFAYKPERTIHLAHYTQDAMRGPSPLSPGLRELIAAYTSRLNHCPF
jgi:alkylhydroperoxidase family enzyme